MNSLMCIGWRGRSCNRSAKAAAADGDGAENAAVPTALDNINGRRL